MVIHGQVEQLTERLNEKFAWKVENEYVTRKVDIQLRWDPVGEEEYSEYLRKDKFSGGSWILAL